jgi:hypothetical protein
MVDKHAPRMILYVEDEQVEQDVTDYIREVKHENSLYLTDEIIVDLINHEGRWSEAVMWGVGNEIELWLGYGADVQYIARLELTRHNPNFPSDGIMTIKLRGLDKSWRMKKQQVKLSGGRTPQRRGGDVKLKWEGTVAGFIRQTARKFGFKHDISPKFDKLKEKFVQKKGQSDFEVLSALANHYYATFRVEYRREAINRSSSLVDARAATPSGAWYLVFRDLDINTQEKLYTFTYFQDESSTLLDVGFEFGIGDGVTEVEAHYWDSTAKGPGGGKGAWVKVTESDPRKVYKTVPVTAPGLTPRGPRVPVIDSKTNKPKTKKVLKKDSDPFHRTYRSQRAKSTDEPHPTKLRLAAAGHSIEILTKPFRNAAEARQFIKTWFEHNKNNFILARGTLPGILIKAGETHVLESPLFGKRYSGYYYFSEVTQRFGEAGWRTTFAARKVITPAWAAEAKLRIEGTQSQAEKEALLAGAG